MPFPSRRPLNPLGETLEALLDARELSDADFARKVGLSKAMVSMIKHRKPSRLPRTVNVEQWATVLNLNTQDREKLLISALLAWSPPEMKAILKRHKLPT